MDRGIEDKIEYEMGLNRNSPIVLVDSEKYGSPSWSSEREGYHRSSNHEFSKSTGIKNLDLDFIMLIFQGYVSDLNIRGAREVVENYFIPTQDKEELIKRQEVVRELFKDGSKLSKVRNIINHTRKLKNWVPEFFDKSVNQFGERTEQVSYLVKAVEASLDLKARSERLKNVTNFAKTIAEKEEYQELKNYVTACASDLFYQYELSKDKLKKIWNLDRTGPFTTAGMLDLCAKVMKDKRFVKKIDLMEFDTRRDIYSALLSLKDVVDKLMNDNRLEHIIDKKEVKVFKLDRRLDQAVEILSDFATVDYKERKKITAAEKFFATKFPDLLYHINKIIDEGLENRMKSLGISSYGLEQELAFYCCLAELAHEMKRVSLVVQPEVLDKEERSCRIKQGNVPSFVMRRISDERHDRDRKTKLVANDVTASKNKRIFLITGANDNGKTTYERMIGQSQVLFQMGGYIPAKEASMSIVDGIFSSFSTKDKPNEKEGNFKSGLKYLHFISVPQRKDPHSGRRYMLDAFEIMSKYNHCDHSFMTPFSLVLLDEIAIGSDSEATEEAIERTINAGTLSGARMYISTHYHPIAARVAKGEFKNTMNLGAIMDHKGKKPIVTYVIKPNRHEQSLGRRLFEDVGYTNERILKGQQLLKEAKIYDLSKTK